MKMCDFFTVKDQLIHLSQLIAAESSIEPKTSQRLLAYNRALQSMKNDHQIFNRSTYLVPKCGKLKRDITSTST
jgi:hypothetical protein